MKHVPREVVIKRAAIRMKGNKPIHKKMWLKKYKTKLKEKKIPWPRVKHGPPKRKVNS